jgi:hypothetical protein
MKKILIGLITSVFLSTAALAGQFGLGVTGSFAGVGASGTESDKDGSADTSVRKAEAAESAIVPSVFAEYSFDNGFTIGYDYTIGSADVNSSKITRTDDSFEAGQDGDRTAGAEISDVMAFYAELPIHAGLYAKGGFVQMTVDTQDSFSGSGTPGLYGSTTVDGIQYGLGYRNTFGENGFYKIEGTYTDMDGITLNSNNADKGNKIQADLDVTKATLAIGVNF